MTQVSKTIKRPSSRAKAAGLTAVPGSREDTHERRRLEVLEAAWRAILRVGLENVTIREIAAEMNATTGTVVHYFRTKDEVLLYALDHLISAMEAEVTRSLEGVSGIERLDCILHASLPLDEEAEAGWRIWVAFLKGSIGNVDLSTEHRKRYTFMRASLTEELGALRKQKLIRGGLDLSVEADALVALIDGIGVGRIIDPDRFPPAQQRMLAKRHVQAFLAPQEPGAPRR